MTVASLIGDQAAAGWRKMTPAEIETAVADDSCRWQHTEAYK